MEVRLSILYYSDNILPNEPYNGGKELFQKLHIYAVLNNFSSKFKLHKLIWDLLLYCKTKSLVKYFKVKVYQCIIFIGIDNWINVS